MEFRNLGNSGLRISEIAYGNWLTHGSQVEQEQALTCVRQALDVGITTFDTADTYADTKAESVLGEALKGERREGVEIFTKVYFPMGQPGQNDHGLSRKHVHQGKALYIGVSEWSAAQLREGHRLARELRIPFVSNQPQYNMLWRVIENA